jgi:hypothetical protein
MEEPSAPASAIDEHTTIRVIMNALLRCREA